MQNSVIDNQTLIIIPLIHDWNWTGNYQRQTALELKKKYNHIIVIDNKNSTNIRKYLLGDSSLITEKERGIKSIRLFHIIPFERFSLIYLLNQKLSLLLLGIYITIHYRNISNIILWIFHPKNLWIYELIRLWICFRIISIYDCMDYFVEDKGVVSKDLVQAEKRLVRNVDIVIAVSHKLLKWLSMERPDTKLVHQGFILPIGKIEAKKMFINRLNKPVIGYVGGINNRIDYHLLIELASSNTQWSFVLWGPIQEKLFVNDQIKFQELCKLMNFPNVTLGVSNNYVETLEIIKHFDVGIIPYDLTTYFNQYCNPLKLYEYFFMGKPVVSSNIDEVVHYEQFVEIASTTADWDLALRKQLRKDWSDVIQISQRSIAVTYSWENRINKILNFIDQIKG